MVGCVYDPPYDKNPDAGHTWSDYVFDKKVNVTHVKDHEDCFLFIVFMKDFSTEGLDVPSDLQCNFKSNAKYNAV